MLHLPLPTSPSHHANALRTPQPRASAVIRLGWRIPCPCSARQAVSKAMGPMPCIQPNQCKVISSEPVVPGAGACHCVMHQGYSLVYKSHKLGIDGRRCSLSLGIQASATRSTENVGFFARESCQQSLIYLCSAQKVIASLLCGNVVPTAAWYIWRAVPMS